MGEDARHEQSRAQTMTATGYEAICAELERHFETAIAAFLDELPEGKSADDVGVVIRTVLTILLVEYTGMFGEVGVPVRVACIAAIDAVIAANQDEIADLSARGGG